MHKKNNIIYTKKTIKFYTFPYKSAKITVINLTKLFRSYKTNILRCTSQFSSSHDQFNCIIDTEVS